jgi:hypothetical protein
MFHKPELRVKYLKHTLPNIFLDPNKRLMIYAFQNLIELNIEITVPNLALYIHSDNEALNNFIKKHKCKRLVESEISDMVYDTEITAKTDLFETAKRYLITYAFARFVEDRQTDIRYWNSYPGEYNSAIVGASKAIVKVHDILSGRLEIKRDQLFETMELVNSDDEYVSTSSQKLNQYIGGWTRGYVGTLIAKSGHTKSSWIDYDTIHSLLKGKIKTAAIISPEESATTRWRRIFAMVCRIPTTAMRQKTATISKEHIEKVAELFKDRLFIYDNVFKYKDVIDLMNSLKTDKIIVDHLQAIDYPGTGDFLARMIGNIPGMLDFQKKLAKQRKIVIINLSQVNDKDIQRSDRLIKAPRYWDAYGSSVLYQASREFLALWYPFKDQEDNQFAIGNVQFSINDIRMSIEKSSFSRIGKVKLEFDPEFNSFKDVYEVKKGDYIPPQEKGLFE